MKNKWLLHWRYFIFWLLFFVAAKAFFVCYHFPKTKQLTTSEVLNIFLYGLRLDASFAGYLSIIPFCRFLLQAIFPRLLIRGGIKIYTFIFIGFICLLSIIDLELYKAWGFRLDATPLQYLNTPNEMLASAGSAPLLLLILLFIILGTIGVLLFKTLLSPEVEIKERQLLYIIACIWYLAFLILPIRGGWQQIPINQSSVYFSNNIFANHAAVNVPWNLMYSLSKKNYTQKNPYQYFPDSTAQRYVNDLYRTEKAGQIPTILKIKRPNILFIILESNTGKLVGCLGGEPGVTPNLDKCAKEGILFDSVYASGDRTEKALVALLSGYPVQTTTSIVKTPRKTEGLPHFSKILQSYGYHSSYYYGGELAFANIKSYLLNAGYGRLISKSNFKPKDYNSKWGVHDHVLLQRVLQDLKSERNPFFTTVLTLSSHEPYEIPIPAKFKNLTDEATQFKNSMYYTDYAIGNFIEAAKKEAWWNNTLVVLVADHGHRFPGDETIDNPRRFRIPFILTGGALALQNTVISKIGSQTDIIPTILHQLDIPAEQFSWSKNLLNPQAKSFAFYVFIDGFGFVTPHGAVTFDNVSKRVLQQDPGVPSWQLNYGKAYMQYSFSDFLRR